MMPRERYIAVMRDLLSGDANRLRAANRELYSMAVGVVESPAAGVSNGNPGRATRDADLVLAEIAQ